jgi:hypothetical protein
MNSPLRDALDRAMVGDVRALDVINRTPHQELAAAVGHETMTLLPLAVSGVLRRLARGEVDGRSAQQWASFMMNGHVPLRGAGSIRPIDIEYESEHEQEIADAVARLEEIGDAIDGDLPTETETRRLLEGLER